MESVVFDGKEYVKASVLAKKFRYTADYLGQLCRAKKVDARLVGRAWYINLDSLQTHRTGRYKTQERQPTQLQSTPKNDEVSVVASANYLSRVDVEPILKKKTVTLLKSTKNTSGSFQVKYEGDDYSLIPRVNREATSKSVRISQAESKDVRIHKGSKAVTRFVSEDLPEVYLKGSISVAGIEEAFEEQKETEETDKIQPETKTYLINEAARPKPVILRSVQSPKPLQEKSASQLFAKPSVQTVPLNKIKPANPVSFQKTPALQRHSDVSVLKQNKPIFEYEKPKSDVRHGEIATVVPENDKTGHSKTSFAPKSVSLKKVESKKKEGLLLPLAVFTSALVLAFCLLGFRSDTVATRGVLDVTHTLDVDQFSAAIQALKF